MADNRISVNSDNLDSVAAYIKAARSTLNRVNATSTVGRHSLLAAKNDLDRALECWNEARLTDEELNEGN